jgi:hypothetical protein
VHERLTVRTNADPPSTADLFTRRERPSTNIILFSFFLVTLLCEIVAAIMMLAGWCHEFSWKHIISVSFFPG